MVYLVPYMATKYDLLIQTNKNIFNVDDLVAIWQSAKRRDALESVKGYIRRGKIFNLYKGIYSLRKDFDYFELAQKLFTPSYISYYSALALHGIIFQKYSDIHLCALDSKVIEINERKFIYHKIKKSILYNQRGLSNEKNYLIASPERAICDSLYLNKNSTFDNLRNLEREKMIAISKIYQNKRLERDIEELFLLRAKND